MPRLLLIRHGLTDWNAQGRIQGSSDTDLNDVGRRQAAALGEHFKDARIDSVYTSDLRRAVETARRALRHHDLPLQLEPRLREAAYGEWEGMTMDEIRAIEPDRAGKWRTDPITITPTGGESVESFGERLGSLLDELRKRPDDERILLVGHGGSIRVLLCLALHIPIVWERQFRVENTSISEVSMTSRRTSLITFNDRSHLNGLNGHGRTIDL